MNHKPQDCLPTYRMCYADCSRTASSGQAYAPPSPTEQLRCELELSQTSEIERKVEGWCGACNASLVRRRACLCEACATTPGKDSDIDFCVRMFKLCAEQQRVLRLAACGHNIFYTGAAGTGKSTVLRAIVRYYHRKSARVEIVSPTGISALMVGGRTIHQFAGWSLVAERTPIKRLERDARKDTNWERLCGTSVLIMDEISMVSNLTFTRLDRIMRAACGVDAPFGGVQIIVAGDFFQLPPVRPFKACLTCGNTMEILSDRPTVHICSHHGLFYDDEKWAFCSSVWDECRFRSVELRQIHRQGDAFFTTLLNKVRVGEPLSGQEESALLGHPVQFDVTKAIKIYPFRNKVAGINEARLNEHDGEEVKFKCADGFEWNQAAHPELKGRFARENPGDETCSFRAYAGSGGEDRHRFDDVFRMKIGMPVILMTNINAANRVVNGSQGTIVGFELYLEEMLPRAKLSWNDVSKHGEWLLAGDPGHFQQEQIRTFVMRATDRRWPIVQLKDGPQRTIYPWCEVQELGAVREEGTQERFSLMSRKSSHTDHVISWTATSHGS